MPRTSKARAGRTVAESFREYGRGVAGGLLFSLPLLYTMEVWFAGFVMPPHRQLAYVLLALVLLLGYNRYAGLHPDTTWTEVAIDSVEEMGIGLLLSGGGSPPPRSADCRNRTPARWSGASWSRR